MIAYFQIPHTQNIGSYHPLFDQLRGVNNWELISTTGAYLALDNWMTQPRIRELYQALRRTFGPRIRFGAATQKTTARAAALYRPVPHCTIINDDATDKFLANLPIDLLPGLGARTTRFLAKYGIRTFGAFRDLPGWRVKEWFGVSGLILQQFARGIDPRSLDRSAPLTIACSGVWSSV